jgi:hypothetical protein
VDEKTPIALEMAETEPVGQLTQPNQGLERVGSERLVVVHVLRLENVRRVQRDTVAHPLRDTSHCCQNGCGRVRRVLVERGRVEANSCGLRLELSDGRTDLFRENTRHEEQTRTSSRVGVRVERRASDGLDERERDKRGHREERAWRWSKR